MTVRAGVAHVMVGAGFFFVAWRACGEGGLPGVLLVAVEAFERGVFFVFAGCGHFLVTGEAGGFL